MKRTISTILFVAALILFTFVFNVLLIVFAGILLAVLLRASADWVHQHAPVSHGVALGLVVCSVVALFAVNIWLFGVNFAGQVDELKSSITAAWTHLSNHANRYQWTREFFAQTGNTSAVLSRAPGAVSGTIHFIASLVLIVMIGLYTAANPTLYRRSFVRFFSRRYRPRVNETLSAMATALRWWLLGQMISMTVVGVLTTIGLVVLGVPLPFTLGFLTAILNFIPNIGAILSASLAALLALTQGPALAAYTLLLYIVIQSFEAYLLTPLIQQRAVQLPPGLTITVQAIMSVLVGGLGLALAAPLTVVGMVLTRKFHFKEDVGRRRAA